MIPLFPQKYQQDVYFFNLLLEINGIKLNISRKIEEERFCFTPYANFQFTEQQ